MALEEGARGETHRFQGGERQGHGWSTREQAAANRYFWTLIQISEANEWQKLPTRSCKISQEAHNFERILGKILQDLSGNKSTQKVKPGSSLKILQNLERSGEWLKIVQDLSRSCKILQDVVQNPLGTAQMSVLSSKVPQIYLIRMVRRESGAMQRWSTTENIEFFLFFFNGIVTRKRGCSGWGRGRSSRVMAGLRFRVRSMHWAGHRSWLAVDPSYALDMRPRVFVPYRQRQYGVLALQAYETHPAICPIVGED
ncbi:hypothetical protein FB451DRAFT_1516928 [Mycena latifolia]|nr:hypothetical protein FB451DRAFT_1516928 [Mycena latifolia]